MKAPALPAPLLLCCLQHLFKRADLAVTSVHNEAFVLLHVML